MMVQLSWPSSSAGAVQPAASVSVLRGLLGILAGYALLGIQHGGWVGSKNKCSKRPEGKCKASDEI